MQKQYLEVGRITRVHALKGEVKVDPWCDNPDFLCRLPYIYFLDDKNNNKFSKAFVTSSRVSKSNVIIKFQDVDSIDQAENLIGKIIYICKSEIKLEKDVYFIQDIIDCDVNDIDTDENYGKVTNVLKTGANDVYEVTDKNKMSYLIPVIDEVVINIDINKREILIRPMEGIFDNEN
jgi:16S rRNA processing protein RimM